jgi:hypothetical protein
MPDAQSSHRLSVFVQFLLDSCRELATLFPEAGDLLVKKEISFSPGIVPGSEIVAQFSGQFRFGHAARISAADGC